jgi:hypothetical protein
MKSPLWVHFTAVGPDRFKQSRQRVFSGGRKGNPTTFSGSTDPRVIGSDDDMDYNSSLTDIEII